MQYSGSGWGTEVWCVYRVHQSLVNSLCVTEPPFHLLSLLLHGSAGLLTGLGGGSSALCDAFALEKTIEFFIT